MWFSCIILIHTALRGSFKKFYLLPHNFEKTYANHMIILLKTWILFVCAFETKSLLKTKILGHIIIIIYINMHL